MNTFVKYPSIEQFRNIVKEIKFLTDESSVLPILSFTGTVKLHGTNAGICLNLATGDLWAQSRNNILTFTEDNAGFAKYVESNYFGIKALIQKYVDAYELTSDSGIISLFGEWCGGNIQKGVGISSLEKMFILFGVKVGESWLPLKADIANTGISFYNTQQFPTYKMTIDFNNPQAKTNELVALTEQVEACCPVAKYFGVVGIGEGVVWESEYLGKVQRFKVKGDKHSTSKVKKLVQIDPEKMNSIQEFVQYVVTNNRMNQAIEQVFTSHSKSPDIKEMGAVIKWVMSDIFKEELDTLNANDLTSKEVTKDCVTKIRHWFITYLDTNL